MNKYYLFILLSFVYPKRDCFQEADTDAFGYPVTKVVNGEPAIEEVKIYELPYLKEEVINIIRWSKIRDKCI